LSASPQLKFRFRERNQRERAHVGARRHGELAGRRTSVKTTWWK
jgi:hypothetical protein